MATYKNAQEIIFNFSNMQYTKNDQGRLVCTEEAFTSRIYTRAEIENNITVLTAEIFALQTRIAEKQTTKAEQEIYLAKCDELGIVNPPSPPTE